MARKYWYSTLFNDDLIVINRSGNGSRYRFDVGEIRIALFGGGSTDGDENSGALTHGSREIGREAESLAGVTLKEFRKILLMNRNFAQL